MNESTSEGQAAEDLRTNAYLMLHSTSSWILCFQFVTDSASEESYNGN